MHPMWLMTVGRSAVGVAANLPLRSILRTKESPSLAYKVSGDTESSLSSGFPGEFASVPVTLGLDTASSAISFQLAINPANGGVRLTRISDQNLS
jgi:hypothetical protein